MYIGAVSVNGRCVYDVIFFLVRIVMGTIINESNVLNCLDICLRLVLINLPTFRNIYL